MTFTNGNKKDPQVDFNSNQLHSRHTAWKQYCINVDLSLERWFNANTKRCAEQKHNFQQTIENLTLSNNNAFEMQHSCNPSRQLTGPSIQSNPASGLPK